MIAQQDSEVCGLHFCISEIQNTSPSPCSILYRAMVYSYALYLIQSHVVTPIGQPSAVERRHGWPVASYYWKAVGRALEHIGVP